MAAPVPFRQADWFWEQKAILHNSVAALSLSPFPPTGNGTRSTAPPPILLFVIRLLPLSLPLRRHSPSSFIFFGESVRLSVKSLMELWWVVASPSPAEPAERERQR